MLRVIKILTGLCISLLALSAFDKLPAYHHVKEEASVKNVSVEGTKAGSFPRRAEDFGRPRPLQTFTDTPQVNFKDCKQQAICTREFLPTICIVNGLEVKGNNRCEALVNLRNYACQRGFVIQREDVSCRYVSTRTAF